MRTGAILLATTLGLPAVLAVGSRPAPPAQNPGAGGVSIVLDGQLTVADLHRLFERTFTVPPGTKALDIDVSYTGAEERTVIDVGVRAPDGLRGWMGGRGDHIHIDRLSATYGYLTGAIEPGPWAIILGIPNIRITVESHYRITIRMSAEEIVPHATLSSRAGWYAGDLHMHSGHSDGYHTETGGRRVPVAVNEVIEHARAARLDFVALTDHNTASHWVEIDRAQAAAADLLLMHAREITTYRGHFNAIGERRFQDFRLTPERTMSRLLSETGADGAFLSINHAWLPSGEACMGCGWMDRDRETIRNVNAIEVVNGPLAADTDLPGWRLWADLLNRGERLVAVGGSDTHDQLGTNRLIGQPATIVYANALSEDAIVEGLKSGRVFVRVDGADGPSLDLAASRGAERAVMGQAIGAGMLTLNAHIEHAAGQEWVWLRRGAEIGVTRLQSDREDVTLPLRAVEGDWVAGIVRRSGHPAAISNAIYVGAPSRP